MTFKSNANTHCDSRIYEMRLLQTRPVEPIGLLRVLQDRACISAYRNRLLNLDSPKQQSRFYLSHSKASRKYELKHASLRHLRLSQKNCFLERWFRFIRDHLVHLHYARERVQNCATSMSARGF